MKIRRRSTRRSLRTFAHRAGGALLSLLLGGNPLAAGVMEGRRFWDDRRAAAARPNAESTEFTALLSQWPGEKPVWGAAATIEGGGSLAGAGGRWAKRGRGAARLTSFRAGDRADAPVVLLVQDLHDVADAQKNISILLADLSAGGDFPLVAVEGATGDFRLDPLRRFVPADLLTSVADGLLQRNMIGGPEHAGLVAPEGPKLFGAEDPTLYHENLAAARAALRRQPALRAALGPARRALADAHARWDSPAAHAHALKAADKAAGRLSLADYAVHLLSQPGAAGAGVPNVRRLATALARERSMDFARVESERRDFLTRLAKTLSARENAELLHRVVEHRAGRLGYGALFDALEGLARRHGLSLSAYPALTGYRQYAEAAEGIERGPLLTELAGLERRVEDALAAGPTARRLLALDRRWRLLTQMVDLSLSPDGWSAYIAERNALRRWPVDLAALGVAVPRFPSPEALRPFESFCERASQRNDALVANTLQRMRQDGARAAALVAGGFHTPGLENALARRGVAVGVFTPRVDVLPTGNPGLAALLEDPRPLEKIFVGEPLSLVSERALGPTVNIDAPHQRAVEGLLAAQIVAPLAAGTVDMAAANERLRALAREALATIDRAEVAAPLRAGEPYRFAFDGPGGPARVAVTATSADPGRPPDSPLTLDVSVDGKPMTLSFAPAARSGRFLDVLEPWSRLSAFRQKIPGLYYALVGLWETAAFRYVGLTVIPGLLVHADFPLWLAASAGLFWAVPGFVFAHTLVRWAFHAPEDGWTWTSFAREWAIEWVPNRKLFLGSRPLLGLTLSGVYALTALLPFDGAAVWALLTTAALHGDWDMSIHRHRSDPVDPQADGEARVRRSLARPVDLSNRWFLSGDFDKLGGKNELLGKDAIGDLFEWTQGPDILFLRRSIFRETREVVAAAARSGGGRVHRGVGGDELIFEFKGTEPKARFFLNRVVSAVDQHFRGKYAFVAIHRPSLVASEINALKALPGAMVLERYGAGYRLIVERKPGRFPSALAAWARLLAGRAPPSPRTDESLLEEIQGALFSQTDLSPLQFERPGAGPFTLSIGAVNAADTLRVLEETTTEADGDWMKGGRWLSGRRADLIEWGYRFANDALNQAKEEGRNRAVLLSGAEAIRDAIPPGRVTREKILALRAEVQTAANTALPENIDHLTGWRTPAAFRSGQRKVRTRVGPYLNYFFIGSYREGAPLQRRGFHETQSLPNVGHQGGNALIQSVFGLAERLFAVAGEPSPKERGARAPPDSGYVAAATDRLASLTAEDLRRFEESIPAEIRSNPVFGVRPTMFVITVDERILKSDPTLPQSPYFVTELMAKAVAELLVRHQTQGGHDFWMKALRSIGDVEVLEKREAADVGAPRLVRVTFSPAKMGPLMNHFRRAQETASRRAHRELTGEPMPIVAVTGSEGLLDNWAESRRIAPEDPGRALDRLFPILRPLGIEAALRERSTTVRLEAAVRSGYARWWARQLTESVAGVDTPSTIERAARWDKRELSPAALAGAAAEAFENGDGAALVLDAAQRLQDIPVVRENDDQTVAWMEALADRLVLSWFARRADLRDAGRVHGVKWLVAAAGLASTGPRGFDAPLFEKLARRLETRLNDDLREISRVESERTRFQSALAENRDVVIDLASAAAREKPILATLERLGKARRESSHSRSRVVFVDRGASTDAALEKEARALAARAGWTFDASADFRYFANEPTHRILFADGKIHLRELALRLQSRPGESLRPLDVFTPSAEGWDLAGVESLVQLLVFLAGDLVYNATERIGQDLQRTKFVSINA